VLFLSVAQSSLALSQEPRYSYYAVGDRVIGPNLYNVKLSEAPQEVLGKSIDLSQQRMAARQKGGDGETIGRIPRLTGETASTSCAAKYTPQGTCMTDGSSNFFLVNQLGYNAATGNFSGSITTNLCPRTSIATPARPDLINQKLPDPMWSNGQQKKLPLVGRAGLGVHGVNLYSSLEAGFKPTWPVPAATATRAWPWATVRSSSSRGPSRQFSCMTVAEGMPNRITTALTWRATTTPQPPPPTHLWWATHSTAMRSMACGKTTAKRPR